MSNYPFFYAESDGLMSDVKKNITDNFKIIENKGNITVIPGGEALPQSGNYVIGDRVYRDDTPDSSFGTWPSIYILISKDADWGWHWRPVQAVISPWVTVSSSVINNVSFEINPNAPFQIALDSKGFCHWRGSIRKTTPNIAANTSFADIVKTIPEELRPNTDIMHTVSLSPVVSAAGKAGNVSGRVFIAKSGIVSFRFANSANATTQCFWLDDIMYNNSATYYYGV